MVEINATKLTLIAKKIAISYSNEADFLIISDIIKIFRFLKINAIFEKIDIDPDNYLKNIKTGISEDSLTFLKRNSIFIHTPFYMKCFSKKNNDIDLIQYLNFALHIIFVVNVFNNGDVYCEQTSFFNTHKHYLTNNSDIINTMSYLKSFLCKKLNKTIIEMINGNDCGKILYTIYFGEKYIIFSLKQTNDSAVIDFIKTLLIYYGLEQYLVYFEGQTSLKSIIAKLEEINKMNVITTTKQLIDCSAREDNCKISFLLHYSNNYLEKSKHGLPVKINEMKVVLNGIFLVKDLVESIKTKKIKIPEEMRLHKILNEGIEVYPNINFWDDLVINPIIILEIAKIDKIC